MVNPQGTSFIPQRPARGKTEPRRVRKVYVLAYIAYVLFFGSLIAAGGVFFFNFSLDVQLDDQSKALAAERDQFNLGDLESVRDLERRIKIAQERLDNHVSVLAIFEALEQSTVQSLRYVGFSYQRFNDSFPQVTFTGTSDRFNNVLFQREVLSSNPILAGSSFKEVQLAATPDERAATGLRDTVSFTLEKMVDTSLIGYTPRTVSEPIESEATESSSGSQQSDAAGISAEQTATSETIQDEPQ